MQKGAALLRSEVGAYFTMNIALAGNTGVVLSALVAVEDFYDFLPVLPR